MNDSPRRWGSPRLFDPEQTDVPTKYKRGILEIMKHNRGW
jgi:hypothetical protein